MFTIITLSYNYYMIMKGSAKLSNTLKLKLPYLLIGFKSCLYLPKVFVSKILFFYQWIGFKFTWYKTFGSLDPDLCRSASGGF